MKNRILGLFFLCLLFVSCKTEDVSLPPQLSGNWDVFNKSELEDLINSYGKSSVNYDKNKPPYVVLDWDNTNSFLDTEEATLIYQLINLKFACTPTELDEVMRMNNSKISSHETKVPSTAILKDETGLTCTVDQICSDINNSYKWLYANYSGLNGGGALTLDQVKVNPNYTNFITKVRALYDMYDVTFGSNVSYTWIFYLYKGMTEVQIRDLVVKSSQYQQTQKIEKVKWVSPTSTDANFPVQQAGVITVTWKNGLRFIPEMVELQNVLRKSGFDVWICTASIQYIISEVSSNPLFGYNNDATRTIGMQTNFVNGKLDNQLVSDAPFTFQEGKTLAIKKYLSGPSGKYGYDPILVAGDSDGDQNMLSDFPGMKKGLIINRNKGKGLILGDLSKQAVDNYGKNGTKYLLQGRDDNKGTFIPNQSFVKFGATTGTLLP